MFSRQGLTISIPQRELAKVELRSSIFDPKVLLETPLSRELAAAVTLILDRCAASGTAVSVIARPELFPYGAPHQWLLDRLGPVRQHICLSDGSAAVALPDFGNQVFFYNGHGGAEALSTLVDRAPELFSRFTAQINTSFKLCGEGRCGPALLLPEAQTAATAERLFPFHLDPFAIEEGVRRLLARPLWLDALAPFERLVYAPMTSVALINPEFLRALHARLTEAFWNKSFAVILRVPEAQEVGQSALRRITAMLTETASAWRNLPVSAAENVFLILDDLEESFAARRRLELVMPTSFAVWRHTPAFYRRLDRLEAHAPETLAQTGRGRLVEDSGALCERLRGLRGDLREEAS